VGWILNRFREKNKITPSFLAVMGFSGFRGAMGINNVLLFLLILMKLLLLQLQLQKRFQEKDQERLC